MRPRTLPVALAGLIFTLVEAVHAGQVPGAASAPDIPISGKDRIEKYGKQRGPLRISDKQHAFGPECQRSGRFQIGFAGLIEAGGFICRGGTSDGQTSMIFTTAPHVYILTRSRETLQVEGENVYRLDPLAFPPDDLELTADVARTFPATQLFAQRAVASGATRRVRS